MTDIRYDKSLPVGHVAPPAAAEGILDDDGEIELQSLDELEAEYGEKDAEIKDDEPLMGEAHLTSGTLASKRKRGGEADKEEAKSFLRSSRWQMVVFFLLAICGYGVLMGIQEDENIMDNKYVGYYCTKVCLPHTTSTKVAFSLQVRRVGRRGGHHEAVRQKGRP
jgi:hypothetical protein